MVNRELLGKEMAKYNCTTKELAAVCGMSLRSMYRRMNGQVDFTVGEIVKCSGRLHLSIGRRNAIFFDGQT